MAKDKKAGPATKGLRIHSKQASYFSAQILPAFTPEPREIPYSDLTAEQVEELQADPWLVVKEVDISAAPAEEPKQPA